MVTKIGQDETHESAERQPASIAFRTSRGYLVTSRTCGDTLWLQLVNGNLGENFTVEMSRPDAVALATFLTEMDRYARVSSISTGGSGMARKPEKLVVFYPYGWMLHDGTESERLRVLRANVEWTWADYVLLPGDVKQPEFRVYWYGGNSMPPPQTKPKHDLLPLAYFIAAIVVALIALFASLRGVM